MRLKQKDFRLKNVKEGLSQPTLLLPSNAIKNEREMFEAHFSVRHDNQKCICAHVNTFFNDVQPEFASLCCWLLTSSIQWSLATYLSKNSLHATCWMPCSYWYMFGMTALNISWSPITVTSFSLFSTYISKNLNMMWHNLKMFLRIVFRMQLIIFIMLTLFNLFLVFRPDNRTRVSE